MSRDRPRLDRLEELLADRALQGLTGEERDELGRLADDPEAEAEGLALELAAAEADLALLDPSDRPPLSASLTARLEADAGAFFAARPSPRPSRPRVVPWLGWVAVAASLLFAMNARRRPPEPPAVAREPTLVERLADVPVRPLSSTDHPLARGGGGTLAWSGERQEGYLALEGLAEVEPARGVYQLWIFDATRDERFPVDGGTFTVEDSKATTLVPIRPAIPVRRPTLFAVTLEPPGGVVVSDRKRILLTASPPP